MKKKKVPAEMPYVKGSSYDYERHAAFFSYILDSMGQGQYVVTERPEIAYENSRSKSTWLTRAFCTLTSLGIYEPEAICAQIAAYTADMHRWIRPDIDLRNMQEVPEGCIEDAHYRYKAALVCAEDGLMEPYARKHKEYLALRNTPGVEKSQLRRLHNRSLVHYRTQPT